MIPMIAAPICSIIAILGLTGHDWPSLYFKRKALEEEKKIEALNDRTAPNESSRSAKAN
jgi:hypothetical protein